MSDAKWHLKKRDSGKVYKDLDLGTIKTWILEARIEADDYLASSETKKWVKANGHSLRLPLGINSIILIYLQVTYNNLPRS